MARLKFRVSGITLDEEEEVAAITAVVRDDTLAIIRAMIPGVTVADRRRGGTEMTITMSAPDMVKLFGECGQIRGTDPRSEHTSQVYDSIARVLYGLMED
jgi:hypothetical protein